MSQQISRPEICPETEELCPLEQHIGLSFPMHYVTSFIGPIVVNIEEVKSGVLWCIVICRGLIIAPLIQQY